MSCRLTNACVSVLAVPACVQSVLVNSLSTLVYETRYEHQGGAELLRVGGVAVPTATESLLHNSLHGEYILKLQNAVMQEPHTAHAEQRSRSVVGVLFSAASKLQEAMPMQKQRHALLAGAASGVSLPGLRVRLSTSAQ